jgi:hypothetical protein
MITKVYATNSTNLTLPTIHLGGTSRAILHEDYQRAYDTLYAAWKAFAEIEFHRRDYLKTADWEAACDARANARHAINSTLDYLYSHIEHTAEPLN